MALDNLPASYDARTLNPFGPGPSTTPAGSAQPQISASRQAELDAVASIFASQGVLTPPPSQQGLLPATPSYAQLILGPPAPPPAFGDPLSFSAITAEPRFAPPAPLESHEAFMARMAQGITSPVPNSPVGPPIPGDWARQPDRPDTAAEVEHARRANALGVTSTIDTFDAPLPYVALDAIIDETSIDWPSSQEEISSLCRAADSLALQFPAVSESMLLIALSLSKYDALEASNWILGLSQNRGDHAALANAFPDAPSADIIAALKKSKQGFRQAYWALARSYSSTWEPSIVGPNPARSALTLDDDEDAEFFGTSADYTSASQTHSDYESKWWNATSLSRSHSVKLSSTAADSWTPVARFCMNKTALAPRSISYIQSLGSLITAPRDYHSAVHHLKLFPSYRAVVNYVLENGNTPQIIDDVAEVITALLHCGLSTPGASAWLAETLSADLDSYQSAFARIGTFGPKFREVWKQRNAALHRWRQIKVTTSVNPPSASGFASQPRTVAVSDSVSDVAPEGSGIGDSPTAHRNRRARVPTESPYAAPPGRRSRALTIVIESSSEEEHIQDVLDSAVPRSSPQQVTLTGKRVTRASLLKKDGKMSRASREDQAVKATRKKELLRARKRKGGKGRQPSPSSDNDPMLD